MCALILPFHFDISMIFLHCSHECWSVQKVWFVVLVVCDLPFLCSALDTAIRLTGGIE